MIEIAHFIDNAHVAGTATGGAERIVALASPADSAKIVVDGRAFNPVHEVLDDPDGGRDAAQPFRSLLGKLALIPGELEFVNFAFNQRSSRFMSAVAACPRNQADQ